MNPCKRRVNSRPIHSRAITEKLQAAIKLLAGSEILTRAKARKHHKNATAKLRSVIWSASGLDLDPAASPTCGSSRITSSALGRRLLRDGVLAPACSQCGGTSWQGVPIPLELDHVNGDRADNRLENLRLLCPNCHAVTDTYRGRNIGRRTVEVEPP